MLKLVKISVLFFYVFVLYSINNSSFAVTAEDVKRCDTGTNLFTGTATACRFTPQTYIANVFEMGLCTVNPMAGASLDRSTCTTVFTATDQVSGSQHDFALGDVQLEGTSSRPANGIYQFPYIILSNTFRIKAEFEKDATNTWYIKEVGGGDNSCGNADLNNAPAEQCTGSLIAFNQTGNCDGEYLGARFEGGTLNGYLMQNSSLDKRDGAGENLGGGPNFACSNVDRLVGVMQLDTPLEITPSVMTFKFTFNVTGYGAQMFTNAGTPNDNPNGGGGTGPFSGFFTITNSPQQ